MIHRVSGIRTSSASPGWWYTSPALGRRAVATDRPLSDVDRENLRKQAGATCPQNIEYVNDADSPEGLDHSGFKNRQR